MSVTAAVLRWTLPHPLAREVAVRAGSAALVAGGLVSGDRSTAACYRLDLVDGHVTPSPPLGIPVHDAAGASIRGTPLVLGGGNSTEQSAVQVLRGRAATAPGRLPTPRADLAAVAFQRRVVVIGGYDGLHSKAAILASTGHRFQTIGRLPVAVRYPTVVAVGSAVWVFGGERAGGLLDTVQEVDARTGQARLVAQLPHPLEQAAAVEFGGRVLLAGGRTGADSVTSAMWWFDPKRATFEHAGRLPFALADSAVVAARGSAYLLGGETPSLSARVIRLTVR